MTNWHPTNQKFGFYDSWSSFDKASSFSCQSYGVRAKLSSSLFDFRFIPIFCKHVAEFIDPKHTGRTLKWSKCSRLFAFVNNFSPVFFCLSRCHSRGAIGHELLPWEYHKWKEALGFFWIEVLELIFRLETCKLQSLVDRLFAATSYSPACSWQPTSPGGVCCPVCLVQAFAESQLFVRGDWGSWIPMTRHQVRDPWHQGWNRTCMAWTGTMLMFLHDDDSILRDLLRRCMKSVWRRAPPMNLMS